MILKKIIFTQEILIFFICLLAVLSTPCVIAGEYDLNFFIKSQKYSSQLIAEYLKNPDVLARVKIENLDDFEDNLPSKIFKSWRIYVSKGRDINTEKRALDVLLQNPYYSLFLIKSIFLEIFPTNEDHILTLESYGINELEVERKIYMNFCYSIARVEKENFAHEILINLSKNKNTKYSVLAKELLQMLKTDNLTYMTNLYKNAKSIGALEWLADNFLRKGLYALDIKKILGDGNSINSFTIVYQAKIDPGSKKKLYLHFNDEILESWTWTQ
jgi:hypothetical protein